MLSTQSIVESDTATLLLPVAQLHEEAHGIRARIRGNDSLRRLSRRLRREDVRADHLPSLRGVVVRRQREIVPGVSSPDIDLGGTLGDLVGLRQGRDVDFQHAACCVRGDVVECYGGDLRVVRGIPSAAEGELLAGRGIVGC